MRGAGRAEQQKNRHGFEYPWPRQQSQQGRQDGGNEGAETEHEQHATQATDLWQGIERLPERHVAHRRQPQGGDDGQQPKRPRALS